MARLGYQIVYPVVSLEVDGEQVPCDPIVTEVYDSAGDAYRAAMAQARARGMKRGMVRDCSTPLRRVPFPRSPRNKHEHKNKKGAA